MNTEDEGYNEDIREIVNMGGILGRLRILHNTRSNGYMMIINGITQVQSAGFKPEQMKHIVEKLVNYLESRKGETDESKQEE